MIRSSSRSRRLVAVAVVSLPLVALATTSAPAGADSRTMCRSTGANTETCHIEEPNVTAAWTPYPAVHLSPCDKVTVTAGGCVQTGGHGKTWKRFVDPIGGQGRLYYGTIRVPGVFDGDWVRDCGGFTCVQNAKHLEDVVNHPFTIPRDVGAPRAHPLEIGFTDDVYRDNGYYGHDDGTNDQCKGSKNAFVDIAIEHATSCPAQQSDGVKDGDESDVDCGGSVAAKCGDGKTCRTNADCSGGTCAWGIGTKVGTCTPAPPCAACTYDVGITTCAAPNHDGYGGCNGIQPGVSITGVQPKPGAQVQVLGIDHDPTDVNGHATLHIRSCKKDYMAFTVQIPNDSLWGSPNPMPPPCSNVGQTYIPIHSNSAPPAGGSGGGEIRRAPPPPPPPHPPHPPFGGGPRGRGGRTNRD